MNIKKILIGLGAVLPLAAAAFFVPAFAATTVIVTPSNLNGWSEGTTGSGGSVGYITDNSSPLPTGALQFVTNNTNEARAQYVKSVSNVPLNNVTDLAYQSKQILGPEYAAPSYFLRVDWNGNDEGGNIAFIYEPYWQNDGSPDAAPVQSGTWQEWDVDSGLFWSNSTVSDESGNCDLTAGAGGPPFYTLTSLKTMCPNAVVTAFGINVGTYNPNYAVNVDKVVFNDTTYNFELVQPTPTATPTNTPTPTVTITPTVTPTVTPPATPTACTGMTFANTIVGTADSEKIIGTNGNDLIFAMGGSDKVEGRGGDDCIVGGDGSDKLLGGADADVILGGNDSDSLEGDNGADKLYGDNGSDSLRGGDGNDTLSGGEGSDSLRGDNNNDSLNGDAGDDSARGGDGNDTCTAESERQCEI